MEYWNNRIDYIDTYLHRSCGRGMLWFGMQLCLFDHGLRPRLFKLNHSVILMDNTENKHYKRMR